VDHFAAARVGVGAHACSLAGAMLLMLKPTPLSAALALGLIGVGYGIVLLARKIANPDAILSGFTTLALLTSLSAGMIMMSLGVIGLYISRIYSQTQNRPVYLIRSVYRSDQGES